MKELHQISVVTDGASRGNPGPGAIGFSIYAGKFRELLEEDSKCIGTATNNEAEYRALIWALERGIRHGASRVVHYTDSELMVKQLRGEYKVRARNLIPLVERIRELKKGYTRVEHVHVPRENRYVTRVDSNINEALDRKT